MDARELTDRELLVLTFEKVESLEETLKGKERPGLVDRVTALETRVDERTSGTSSRKEVVGFTATFSALLLVVSEYLKSRLGVG